MNKKRLKEKWIPFFENMDNEKISDNERFETMKKQGYWDSDAFYQSALLDIKDIVYER